MNGLFQKVFYATGAAFELARGIILVAVVLALVNVFIVTVNVVSGPSMEPNFHDGQYVIVDRLSFFTRNPKRGEAVVLRFPGDPDKIRYIKRVIGLPGDHLVIKDNQIFINGTPLKERYIPEETRTVPDLDITLKEKEYFCMGDNRENSNDSRVFGPIERRFMSGIAYFIVFPFKNIGLVPPQYY